MSNQLPSGQGVRERILVEVDSLRQRYVAARDADGRFVWCGDEYWIDKIRWLVLPMATAQRIGVDTLTTVPDSQYDEIELKGCRKCTASVFDMVRMLGALVAGREPTRHAGDFINYAVVQPLLNPAFASLFWFGLSWQLRPEQDAKNLGDAIGGMAFDLSTYPASRSEAADVRKAQVELLRKRFVRDLDAQQWLAASDKEWADHCTELMHARSNEIDSVFFEARHQAERL